MQLPGGAGCSWEPGLGEAELGKAGGREGCLGPAGDTGKALGQCWSAVLERSPLRLRELGCCLPLWPHFAGRVGSPRRVAGVSCEMEGGAGPACRAQGGVSTREDMVAGRLGVCGVSRGEDGELLEYSTEVEEEVETVEARPGGGPASWGPGQCSFNSLKLP